MYRKILVALDGSATAQGAFEHALGLAQEMDASLLLVHVVDTYPIALEVATPASWQEISDRLRREGQALLDRARSAAIARGVAADARLIERTLVRVAEIVLQQARAAGCDLIVMGTHGRRGFARLMLGSDAERVARETSLPLLLVRHPEAGKQVSAHPGAAGP